MNTLKEKQNSARVGNEPSRTRQYADILMNIAVVVLGTLGTVISVMRSGAAALQFYTVESNILGIIACAVYAVYAIIRLKTGKVVPRPVFMLKYIATCCLAVTFTVVLLVLAPMNGLHGYIVFFFGGDMLYHHFLCPVLCFISMILFEKQTERPFKAALTALIPTLIYAVITVSLNIAKLMHGPYPFLFVYEQPWWMSVIWFILIPAIAFLLALLTAKLTMKKKK